MPFIKWYKKYELGIEELDEHHRHLVDLLNMAYTGINNGAERDELGAVLDELSRYAQYHFAAEEHGMEVNQFPNPSIHINEHEKFSTRIKGFQKEFHAGRSDLSVEVVQFLYNWLMYHILHTDAEYGRFVKGLHKGAPAHP
jgi:hemerythrin